MSKLPQRPFCGQNLEYIYLPYNVTGLPSFLSQQNTNGPKQSYLADTVSNVLAGELLVSPRVVRCVRSRSIPASSSCIPSHVLAWRRLVQPSVRGLYSSHYSLCSLTYLLHSRRSFVQPHPGLVGPTWPPTQTHNASDSPFTTTSGTEARHASVMQLVECRNRVSQGNQQRPILCGLPLQDWQFMRLDEYHRLIV